MFLFPFQLFVRLPFFIEKQRAEFIDLRQLQVIVEPLRKRRLVPRAEGDRPVVAVRAAILDRDGQRLRRAVQHLEAELDAIALVVDERAVAHRAVDKLLIPVVRLEVDAGRRRRAVGVLHDTLMIIAFYATLFVINCLMA